MRVQPAAPRIPRPRGQVRRGAERARRALIRGRGRLDLEVEQKEGPGQAESAVNGAVGGSLLRRAPEHMFAS